MRIMVITIKKVFNTRSLASLLINFKDAYILLKIEVKIPFDPTDQGKKISSEINFS